MTISNKEWRCHGCGEEMVLVEPDYQEKYCCSGAANECGCMGAPINPVFCEKCENQLFKPATIECECCGELKDPSDFTMDTCEDDIFCDFCMSVSKEDQIAVDDTLLHAMGDSTDINEAKRAIKQARAQVHGKFANDG